MSYNRGEILQQAIKAIQEEECVTIEEILLYLPICKQTFYTYGLDEVDELKAALQAMKVRLKKKMRRNWRNSDNATLQIAEFKLMATDDEVERLTISKIKQDHTIKMPNITIVEDSSDSGIQEEQEGPGQ